MPAGPLSARRLVRSLVLACAVAPAVAPPAGAHVRALAAPDRVTVAELGARGLPVRARVRPGERAVRLALLPAGARRAVAARTFRPDRRGGLRVRWRLGRIVPGRYVLRARSGPSARRMRGRTRRAWLTVTAPGRAPTGGPPTGGPAPVTPGPATAVGSTLSATPAEPFVSPSGTPVRLHGFNVVPVWAGSPGQTWEQARYDQIAAKRFNAVRFVLHWDDFEPARGAFDQTHLATLDTAIARARAAGLYVILDCIHLYGSDGMALVPAWARTGDSVTAVRTNGGGYLKMLAARYRDEPAVAGYDLVNEFYRWPIDQNTVLRAYDGLIAEVRSVDPTKIILIEPTYGDTSIAGSLADFSNLTHRTNVVWSIHDYFAGGDDDGYAADGSQTGSYAWDGTTGYADPDPGQLEAHLKVHLDKTRAAGIPMWIGEFGIGEGAANHDRFIADKVALYGKHGLGRAWWEYHTTEAFSATNPDKTWKPWIDLLLGGG